MRINLSLVVLAMFTASVVHADAYETLLRRYEKQIHRQERQLQGLKVRLEEKERDAGRWQQKAEESKSAWTRAGTAAAAAREKIKTVAQQLNKTKTLAEAAEWTTTEHRLLAQASDAQLGAVTRELYARQLTPAYQDPSDLSGVYYVSMAGRLSDLSTSTHEQAAQASEQETSLRTEEMRWQTEQGRQTDALDTIQTQEQSSWLRWQEAQRKLAALQEEKMQMEQSEQALHVMLQELQEHRDHTLAFRQGRAASIPALAGLKGTLPWPAEGKVTQNFGRQYSSDLNQLMISNGIKIESAIGRSVRAIEGGKVLFANSFQQYGPLVIIQHKNGLTSVYGGLGETRVKEGDLVSTLDAIGTIGNAGSFYFELRCDEQPINPLTYLTPNHRSEISLRRTFP